ncbi:hypothetical protein K438DRAFT_1806533 [Mycena galopus ATCC 62051]|nr:hypothetical protein K438DRAFT_1806533 [Mycena galopus ATCC 62051]
MSQPVVLRTKSLRIPTEALKAPIPPSLLQSPHLNSPQSVFRRAMPPRAPNVDDEWLQDTVPQRGAFESPQKTKISAEPARRPSHPAFAQRPYATPAGRPPLVSRNTEPDTQRRSPAAQDGYFVGF